MVNHQTGFQQQLYDKELALASPPPHNTFIHFLSCIPVVSAGIATLKAVFRVLFNVGHYCNSQYSLFQRLLHTHSTQQESTAQLRPEPSQLKRHYARHPS